jgi:hypothetical protein
VSARRQSAAGQRARVVAVSHRPPSPLALCCRIAHFLADAESGVLHLPTDAAVSAMTLELRTRLPATGDEQQSHSVIFATVEEEAMT